MSAFSAIAAVLGQSAAGHNPAMLQVLASRPFSAAARQVAFKHATTVEALRGPRKTGGLVRARWELMWLLHKQRGIASTRVAMFLNRNHSTVLHGVRKHEAMLGAQRVAA